MVNNDLTVGNGTLWKAFDAGGKSIDLPDGKDLKVVVTFAPRPK